MKINKISGLAGFVGQDAAGLTEIFEEHKNALRAVALKQVKKMIKPRPTFGHKGTFGHVLIIAGSPGRLGASVLSAKAALKTGCGLVTAFVPDDAVTPLLIHLPEAMAVSRNGTEISEVLAAGTFDAVGFGPGAGTGEESIGILHYLLHQYKGPLIIDADGLTVLSKNRNWYSSLRSNVILTPHPKEFDRLTQPHATNAERLQSQIDFAKTGATILLKGHHTSVVANGSICFNTTGNNAMATAGSGDVLTGMITSLCAQGYEAENAAIIGAWLHGEAGDIAAKKHSVYSMIASDIVDEIGEGFTRVLK